MGAGGGVLVGAVDFLQGIQPRQNGKVGGQSCFFQVKCDWVMFRIDCPAPGIRAKGDGPSPRDCIDQG